MNGKETTTGDHGEFTIHADEIAIFSKIPANTEVKVMELNKGQIYDVSYQAFDSTGKALPAGKNATVTSAGHVKVKVTNNAENATKSLKVVKKFLVNGKEQTDAPNRSEFANANFILQEKQSDGTYLNLSSENYYSSFPADSTGKSKSLTFEQLDPTKIYRVVEEITEATDGGSSDTTPYSSTGYMIGSETSSTQCNPDKTTKPGTTLLASGDITLQKEESGKYTYHNNTVTFINEYKSVDVEFTKVDADNMSPVAGAVFALYTDATAETAYQKNGAPVTATSGENGKVTFTGLPYGATYYMKEIQAPSGYVLDNSTIYTISITVNGTASILKADGSVISDNKIKNTATELTFFKKSKAANGTEISLDGAVFEIKRLEGSEYKPVTGIADVDSDGRFTIPTDGIKLTHLLDGTYQLTEITAPAGYNLLTDPITFVIENGLLKQPETKSEVVTFDSAAKTVTIFNTAGIELPETGGMGTLMTTMSGMALMLIALGYLILVKRREKGGLN